MSVRTFEFHRDYDVTGYSGTGVVAEGVTFDDGVTVVHWRGERRSTVVWQSVEDAIAVHGHDGATRLVWTDYREVWSTEVPPGGMVCGTCGQPVESEPCPEHAPAALAEGADRG